ncbi:MAG TPA: NUDIX domain-containing protein [Candidatus Saccharimonadales bacterium]
MSKDKFKLIPAVHLLLIDNDKILLLRRFNTGYEDGKYSVVAGHVDGGETASEAMSREAFEEAGIKIDRRDFEFAHVMHRMAEEERIDFFFTSKVWKGNPINREPDKCDGLSWFSLNNLPNDVIPYVAHAIHCYRKGIEYSEFGW